MPLKGVITTVFFLSASVVIVIVTFLLAEDFVRVAVAGFCLVLTVFICDAIGVPDEALSFSYTNIKILG